MLGRGPGLITIIYVVIGVFVAEDKNYLKDLDNVERIISAILAILLWPLVLLDVNLHINESVVTLLF